MKFSMALLLVTLLGTAPLTAQGIPHGYLNEMPDPARVLADIHGSDSLDTAARQRVALEILSSIVEEFARHEGLNLRLTPEEMELNGRYRRASGEIISATYHTLDPNDQQKNDANSPRAEWNQLCNQYRRNETFIRKLLERYLSPRNRDRYLEILRPYLVSYHAAQAAQKAQQDKVVPAAACCTALPAGSSSGIWLDFGAIALLLFAFGLVRETRPFGLDDSDPFTIRSGWSTYKVYSSTGTVFSPTKSRVVRTSVSGGGSQPVSTSTSTSIYDQFFIREADGSERPVQLTNVNVALREGHQVSAVWAIGKGKKSGSYLLFRNHSTRNVDLINGVLESMMRPSRWLVLPLLLLSLVFAFNFLPFNTCLWCFFRNNSMSQMPWKLETQQQRVEAEVVWNDLPWTTIGLLLATVLAVLVGFSIATAIIRNLRVRRLKRQMTDKLLPILDQRAP